MNNYEMYYYTGHGSRIEGRLESTAVIHVMLHYSAAYNDVAFYVIMMFKALNEGIVVEVVGGEARLL